MKKALSTILTLILISCSNQDSKITENTENDMTQVTISTSIGDIQLELDGEKLLLVLDIMRGQYSIELLMVLWFKVVG